MSRLHVLDHCTFHFWQAFFFEYHEQVCFYFIALSGFNLSSKWHWCPHVWKKTYSKCPLGYDFQWTNQDELPSLHNKYIKTVCALVPPAFMRCPFYPAPAPWTSSVHHCQKAYEVLRWGAQNWGCVFDFTSKRQYSVAHIIILEQRELKEMSRLKILISHSERQRASPWVLLLW